MSLLSPPLFLQRSEAWWTRQLGTPTAAAAAAKCSAPNLPRPCCRPCVASLLRPPPHRPRLHSRAAGLGALPHVLPLVLVAHMPRPICWHQQRHLTPHAMHPVPRSLILFLFRTLSIPICMLQALSVQLLFFPFASGQTNRWPRPVVFWCPALFWCALPLPPSAQVCLHAEIRLHTMSSIAC